MKFLLLLFIPLYSVGQTNCEGIIVEKISGRKVPYATISLVKENKTISANELGWFNIRSSFPQTDSIQISCVGYKTIRLPVSEWKKESLISLEQDSGILRSVVITSNRKNQVYTLHKYKHPSPFTYRHGPQSIHQLAQRFDAPKQGMQLIELKLYQNSLPSIFRLFFYDVDSLTHGPGRYLADTLIELKSAEKQVKIDLEQSGILIPGKSFFVGLEWLFIPANADDGDPIINGTDTVRYFYRPVLHYMRNKLAGNGQIWQLNSNGSWANWWIRSIDHFQITAKVR